MSTNFSIVAGTSGSFAALLTPPGGGQAPATVPQWTSSDASVALVPAADGLSCDAAVPAGFTSTTFDLSISAVSSDSSVGTVTNKHTITVTQPTPPPPAPLTAIDFAQTA